MKAVPFGPVRVTSEEAAQKLLSSLRGPRGQRPQRITLDITPFVAKPSKKPQVAFRLWWGTWSGLSFYG